MPNRIQALTLDARVTGSFRNFVSGTESALAHFGWVNTNASGTIDFATVNPLAGTSQFRGYSVWRLNDAFQTVAPVFVKVEYGVGSVQGRSAIAVTVGRAHDGSGTLSQAGSRIVSAFGTMTKDDPLPVFSAGDTGWGIVAYSNASADQTPFVWGVERGRDLKGNINPNIVVAYVMNNVTSTTLMSTVSNMATGTLPVDVRDSITGPELPIFLPYDNTGFTVDNIYSISEAPVGMNAPSSIKNCGPLTNFLYGKEGKFDPSGDTVTFAPYDQPMQYINLGNTYYANDNLAVGDFSLFMRWT